MKRIAAIYRAERFSPNSTDKDHRIMDAVCIRMMPQNIPGTEWQWGMWIWVLAYISGIICHTGQSSLADYYRQIHLFFLKGKEGSELDTYRQQRASYESLPPKAWLG